MNILTDELPSAVVVDGEEVPINTDFRSSLLAIMAFEDEDLTQSERAAILLRNLYGDAVPANVAEAIRLAMKFLNGGEDSGGDEVSPLRLYSFAKDASLIYAAFMQTHGVDLETANMHWWKFLALFMDLGQETTFCQLVGLRKRIKDGSASKEDRKLYREIYDIAHIEDTRTPEQLEAVRKFEELRNKRKVTNGS